jgi:hypothetical protein
MTLEGWPLGGDIRDSAPETRLIDVIDRLLDRGVALRAEVWLTVAGIDLVFIGAQVIIASPDAMTRARDRIAAEDAP